MNENHKTSPIESNPEVAARLVEIRGNVRRLPWVKIALLLRFVQQNAKWPFEGANSYSEWLVLHTSDLGAGLTMLRTYVWMAQYYEKELRPKLLQWNYPAPPLDELPEHIGPEMLADLRKISRAGVADVEQYYAERVMNGTARRAETREGWVACRKTIKLDPHSRGRIPTDNYKRGPRMTGTLFEAEMLSALLMHNGIFTKTGEFIECKVIQNTQRLIPGIQLPDFIVACKETTGGLSLHAVEPRLSINERTNAYTKDYQPYFDQVWLAVLSTRIGSFHNYMRQLEIFDRVLVVDNGKVSIWQESEKGRARGNNVGLLTRLLLARELW